MSTHLLPNFHLQIPSRPENIALVEPFVEQIKQYRTFSDDKYFDILLVLTEAVCGFNPRSLPDPTHTACRAEPNGRGVFLMQKLADEIQFNNSNNKTIVSILFNV